MSSYYRQQGFSRRQRILHRFRYVAFFVLLIVLIGLAVLMFDVFRQTRTSDTPTQSTTPISSTIESNTQIQTSPYFQFQTPKKWRAIANETREGHYVYRQYNGQLVEQEFVIDVNPVSAEVLALTHTTRVLAVRAPASGALQLEGGVSDHCKKAVKPGAEKTNQMVKMNQVTFACNPDGTIFKVAVGLVGGTTDMSLVRPDGTRAVYRLTYQNVSAQPTARDIDNLVSTFETR